MNEEEKQAVEKMQYILDLINKNGQYTADEKDIKHIIVITNLIIKYQKEIEKLKEESIGDTKFDKLLFSIRMLHFHNYVNDKQFAEMIKKLSNENKGE